MIRSPQDLIEIYQAEQAEKEAVRAREELLFLLNAPGWKRIERWLSDRRDHAFQQLRDVKGDSRAVAESFWKWQQLDAIYEDIENFIRQSMEQGADVLSRQETSAEEFFLKERLHGGSDTGPSSTGFGTGRATGDSSEYT